MAQSWSEFVSGLLQSSTKVDKAVVFNSRGQPLAASEGLQVSEKDGLAILRCLRDPAHTLTRISVDDTDFRCFQGNGNALVGMATNVARRVLVARITEEGAVVVVMGMSSSQGSFLFEVQQSLVERTHHQMAPQGPSSSGAGESSQQTMLQRKLIKTPPSAVSQEQVLVQLHD